MQTRYAKAQKGSSTIRQHLISADYNLPVLPFHSLPTCSPLLSSDTNVDHLKGFRSHDWPTAIINRHFIIVLGSAACLGLTS